MWKLLEECTMTCLGSNMEVSDELLLHESTSAVQSIKVALFKALNCMLAAMEEMYPASNLHIDVLKKEGSQQRNGVFLSDGLLGTIEEKHYAV